MSEEKERLYLEKFLFRFNEKFVVNRITGCWEWTPPLNPRFGPAGLNARKTHCVKGHVFSKENTIPVKNKNGTIGRACRTCREDSNRRSNERRVR